MLRRHRKLLLAAAGLALVSVLGIVLLRENQPQYKGRSLQYWVELRARPPAPAAPDYSSQPRYEDSATAIRHIGTNAIPFLLKWVAYDPPVAMQALERLVWQGGMFTSPFARLPFFRQRTRAEAVFYAFLVLGPDAGCAIPALTRLAENPEKPVVADRAQKCIMVILLMAQKAQPPGSLSPLVLSALTSSSQLLSNVAADVQITSRAAASLRFAPPEPSVSLTLTNVYPPTPLPIGDH